MTENKRFVTNKYKIYDLYKDDEWLCHEVDAEEVVEIMNNLDNKARERSKALSKLHKENEQLKQQIKEVKAYNNWLVTVLQDSGAIVEIKKGDVE